MKKQLLAILMGSVLVASSGIAGAADDLEFESELSGAQEVTDPPGGVDSGGEGQITADFDDGLTKVRVRLRVGGLEGDFTRAHFHCARAGRNGPIAFGLVDPGSCSFGKGRIRCTLRNDDLTDVANNCQEAIGRPVNNIAALAFAMRDGLIYFNLHTSKFPGGELRGQMLPDN